MAATATADAGGRQINVASAAHAQVPHALLRSVDVEKGYQQTAETDKNSDKFRPRTIKLGERRVGFRESMAKPGIKEAERQSRTKENKMQRGRRNVHMKAL